MAKMREVKKITRLRVLILLCAVIVSVTSLECPYTKCQCSGTSISCFGPSYVELPVINDTIPGFLSFATMSNTLTTIPNHSLPEGLQFMKFKTTPITVIAPGALEKSADTLKSFELDSSGLTKFPDAFRSLTALTNLIFLFSPITDWNVDAMKQIGNTVESLTMAGVDLTSWPSWMSYFSSLDHLQLSRDPISTIPDDAFDRFKDTITYLTLSDVNLTSVSKAFAGLSNLGTLFIPSNAITDMENLPQSAKLQSLVLSENRISSTASLVKQLAPYSDSLRYLGLDGNQLTAAPDLSGMHALRILDLTGNDISEASPSFFPDTLENLYLSYNKLTAVPSSVSSMSNLSIFLIASNAITSIKGTDFPAELPELDVSNNSITELQDDSFPKNASLLHLYVSSNPISKISQLAFSGLKMLQTLGLQSTSLTRVPLALSSLTKLQTLQMQDNSNLECTCDEAALVPWFKALPNMQVYGNCGNETISHFFRVVAPVKCHD